MGTLIPFNRSQPQGTLASCAVRPLDAEGVLLAGTGTVRTRSALWALAGEEIVAHLERVCTWRADLRDSAWQPGDYSFYVLEFRNSGGASLFLQFWSEPDEQVVGFEVCSGASNEATARHMNRRRQEDLRDRGFELGGGAINFIKQVCVESPGAIRALAREALGILCRVLGYDGSMDLKYHLHLGTRLESKAVHTGINSDDLAKLLRGWSCRVEPRIDQETGLPLPNMMSCEYRGHFFAVWLVRGLCQQPGQNGVVCFRRYLADKSLPRAQLANHINRNLLGMQASLDADGELQMDQAIILDGGVSTDNLRAQLLLWYANLESVADMLRGSDEASN
jgi:hypothetical protein